MMKKLSGVLFFCCIMAVAVAQTKVIFQVEAGSRAPWGTNQNLTIDSKGKCDYRLTEVHKGTKDSLKFTLTKAQVDTFLKRVDELGFFRLDSNYVQGNDGSGIIMAMNYAGKVHYVNIVNTEIPEMKKMVAVLNDLLKAHKIKIDY